jgi:hypothetical protein
MPKKKTQMMRRCLLACTLVGAVLRNAAIASPEELGADEAQARIRVVADAFATGDGARVAETLAFPSALADGPEAVRAEADRLAKSGFAKMIPLYFASLDVWAVDAYLRGPGVHEDAAPQKASRVLCRSRLPALSSKANRVTVFALFFVSADGDWRLFWRQRALPWLTWEYGFSTPEEAHASVIAALDWRDFRTVYEVIDPTSLAAGIPMAEWLRAVQTRQAAIDTWEADRAAARATAKAEGRPQPADPPPPFVIIAHRAHVASARYEDDGKTVAQVSHLWDYADKLKGPVPYETFVKRGERWYWQPKPEYTLWPLVTNASALPPASQPAQSASPSPGTTGQSAASQPSSKPKHRYLDLMLEKAKAAWARNDYAMAEQLAKDVLAHPAANEDQKRRAQLILDRVAESRSGAATSQPAAPPATQPSSAPTGQQP